MFALPPHLQGRTDSAVVLVDDHRRVVDASPAAARLTGLRREQLVGRTLDALGAAEARRHMPSLWWALMKGGSLAGRLPLRIDDEEVPVEFTLVAHIEPGRHLATWTPVASSPRHGAGNVHGRRALSARELEVLTLVARGFTSSEIARQLQLAEATVESHVRRSVAALGAANRTHAIALVVGRGLIEAPHT
jgi:DNA-binding CsgD family transcriptional regulator